MDEAQIDRCGYTWPEDHEVLDDPRPVDCFQQSCCVRETLDDTDRCPWHADPENTDQKTIENLKAVRADKESVEKPTPSAEILDGAILRNVELGNCLPLSHVRLRQVDLRGADLRQAELCGADLSRADLSRGDLFRANLREANLFDAEVQEANLSDVNLRDAVIKKTDLHRADLLRADLHEANLEDANLRGANLYDANLSEAYLGGADLSQGDLRRANLNGTVLVGADLTEADLSNADLPGANLERAKLIGVNFFDANLTKITPYGARIEAVQINDGTDFNTDTKEYRRWWEREGTMLAAPPRCGYDPEIEQPEEAADTEREELLTKAADTYRQFEELARQNTQPSLQSSMFVLRQDMQRERYREREQYGQWFTNWLFRAVFKHGESFARILLTAGVLILAFAGMYWQADLIIDNPGADPQNQTFIDNPLDAVYFSTLTFTTLGLGDFQPAAASQLGRGLVLLQAVLGAILIATFVFVLGRRAAR